MKIKHLSILVLIIFAGCKNSNPVKTEGEKQRSVHLIFPGQPETIKESTSLNGQEIDMIVNSLPLDSSFFVHYQLKFKDSVDYSETYQQEFFAGFLTFILNDLGLQLGRISQFDLDQTTGFDFEIQIPNSSVLKSSRGKALFLDNEANIWFAFALSESSNLQVSEFLNNYKIE